MRQEIRYHLMDPTGNRTVLVETSVSPTQYAAAAAQLMQLEPTAEQVGFLAQSENADIALCMAGGEFCANAAMSAAAFHAARAGLLQGRVSVQVSGAKEPVAVEIAARPEGIWQGIVTMPRPLSVDDVCFADGQCVPVVSFEGISHVILEEEMPRENAEALAAQRCAQLHVDALGLMFLDRAQGRLTPLVYVPGADTMFWENACGSGTAAVGAYLASQAGQAVTVSLRQPGGTLEIAALPDGALRLCGTVRRVYERTVGIAV